MNANRIKEQVEDQLLHTALESMAYVAYGKVLARENAKRFDISQYDSEKLLHNACAALTEHLQKMRTRRMDAKLRMAKSLVRQLAALQAKLDKNNSKQ